MNLLIGISGKMGSGKTTLARFLQSGFLDSEILSLATPIKDIVVKNFSCGRIRFGSDLDNAKIKDMVTPCGKTYRELMQLVGRFGRELWKDVWLENLKRRIEMSINDTIIVPDIRYPNEADYFVEHGTLIRLTHSPHSSMDETEIALDNYTKWSYIIDNANMTEAEKNKDVQSLLTATMAQSYNIVG